MHRLAICFATEVISALMSCEQVPMCNCHKHGRECGEECLNRQLYIECAPDLCCTLARSQPNPEAGAHAFNCLGSTATTSTLEQKTASASGNVASENDQISDDAKTANEKSENENSKQTVNTADGKDVPLASIASTSTLEEKSDNVASDDDNISEDAKTTNEKSENASSEKPVNTADGKDVSLIKPKKCKHKYCSNTRIQRMDYAPIDIFHTTNKGWGLRTLMALREGDFVGEYCGEVITKEECARRVAEKAATDNYNLYCASLMGDLVVDAEYYGGYVSGAQ